MSFTIRILGSGAAAPTAFRGLSATSVVINNVGCLLDCGEGTQMKMRKFGVKPGRLRYIFITHLHGDHFFGLIGLLFSLHLNNRKDVLHVFAMPELKQILDLQIQLSIPNLSFNLVFHALNPDSVEQIVDEKHFTVTSVPLVHRIPSCGFVFKEKVKPRKISKEFIEREQPSVEQIKAIARGEGFTGVSGKHYNNQDISTEVPLKSFAFITDTSYTESIVPQIQNISVLYHEATFMDDMEHIASQKGHSTVKQAAQIAKLARAGSLILGHVSARYDDMDLFCSEAQGLFAETQVAYDGMQIEVK
jgi:ribonuclease Z